MVENPCPCEAISKSTYGAVADGERLARVLTDKHIRGDTGEIKTTAFSLSDISRDGLSLVRMDKIDVIEFQAVAENIRALGNAKFVRAMAIWAAILIRRVKTENGKRALCVFDDPVKAAGDVRANEAHAIAVSAAEIDDLDAKEIRDELIDLFFRAESLTDAWLSKPPTHTSLSSIATF